jgi:hypothetical protein
MNTSEHTAVAASITLASELARLRFDWGHCYIFRAEFGAPVAERRDTGATVRAPNCDALLRAVQDDHATNPGPEQFRIPEASLVMAASPVEPPSPGGGTRRIRLGQGRALEAGVPWFGRGGSTVPAPHPSPCFPVARGRVPEDAVHRSPDPVHRVIPMTDTPTQISREVLPKRTPGKALLATASDGHERPRPGTPGTRP